MCGEDASRHRSGDGADDGHAARGVDNIVRITRGVDRDMSWLAADRAGSTRVEMCLGEGGHSLLIVYSMMDSG